MATDAPDRTRLSAGIRQRALDLGFEAVGICRLHPSDYMGEPHTALPPDVGEPATGVMARYARGLLR